MRIAFVQPAWDFAGSIYFGCRSAHLPLELGYAAALSDAKGAETRLFDGAYDGLDARGLADAVAAFAPDMTVVTTAPSYLFWRCPPPELRSPRAFLAALGDRGGRTVAIGPHGSSTPGAALDKLGCTMLVRGEAEEIVARLASGAAAPDVPALAWREDGRLRLTGGPHTGDFAKAPALSWPDRWIAAHDHHHHRYGSSGPGYGAEMETSRGCPYRCSFCAKTDHRDAYRRRPLPIILEELDRLIAQGVGYVYFIDEIFLPRADLLDALAARGVQFGVQTRIELWSRAALERLGAAGCVSIEAGLESLTREGRDALDKGRSTDTEVLEDLLIHARKHVPFVQANLIATPSDDNEAIAAWRARMAAQGVWANDPVPLFRYPGSPDYLRSYGPPDDAAWDRAHADYLHDNPLLSDIQDERPLPLSVLDCC